MSQQDSCYTNSYLQHTLSGSSSFIGVGLHSGHETAMRIFPAEADSGIVFYHMDVEACRAEVPALWHNVVDTRLSTTLGNAAGVRVTTVEHLLAALYGCGIDNARIVLDGTEVPIMDGSALPFMAVMQKIGAIRQSALRRAILIKQPLLVSDQDKYTGFIPAAMPRISLEINFGSEVIGVQELSLPIDEVTFRNELTAARTFGFAEQISTLRALGLAKGGSLRNAVLIKENRVINEGGLRFQDEFVRYKALDCISDMALLGARIIGHFKGCRTGHQINSALLRELMLRENAWEYTTLLEAQACCKTSREASADNAVRGMLKAVDK